MLDGRVKACIQSCGILAIRECQAHGNLAKHEIDDLVVVNLYPFEATVKSRL